MDATRPGSLVAALALLAGEAAAHGGSHEAGGGHGPPLWLSAAALVVGFGLLAASAYADERGLLGAQAANAGVAVGVVVALAGLGTAVL